MTTFRAGAATADITPAPGGLMDGYGNRREGSQSVHDPLMARALVLDDGRTSCAIVSCDLLGMHVDVTADIRRFTTAATGIPADAVLIAATHNHAGPAGLRGGMFARLDGALAQAFVDKVSGAIATAWQERRSSTIAVGSAAIETVSMNRRDPAWPIDPLMRVAVFEGEDGRTIASLVNFACHATVLNGANLQLSGEFPGAACRLLQQQTGAPAVYLNGACGNVNPVWIRQDFASVERVGQVVGGQALRTIAELRTLGPGQRAHNIRWDEFPEKPVLGRLVQPSLKISRLELDLPLREFDPDEEYAARVDKLDEQAHALPERSPARREAMAQLQRVANERWAAVWTRRQPEMTAQRAQLQAIRLGEGLAVLALPGEFFVETAAAIRSQAGIEDLFIACYANDYIGYIVPPEAYAQGGYEAGITFCGPEAEGIIVDASLRALRETQDGV